MRRTVLILCLLLITLSGCATSRHRSTEQRWILDPEDGDFAKALAHYAQGLIYEQRFGTADMRAIQAFTQAAELDPGRRRIRSKIAMGYLLRQETDKAIRTLEEACRVKPDDLQSRVDLAVACQLCERYHDAIRHLQAALEMAPDETFLYLGLARLHIRTGDDAKAVEILRKGIPSANSRQLFAFASERGRQLVERSDLEAAVPYFEILLENSGLRRPEIYNLIGQIHLELQQPDAAARSFRLATLEDPTLPDSFVKLGMIELRQGESTRAVEVLERGRVRFPDNPLILFSLSLAYNAQERYDEALEILERLAQDAAPDEKQTLTPEFYLQYGAVSDRAGRVAAAERILSACVEQYPDAHEALNYLAYLWAESDVNLDLALAYVRRALEKEPENGAYVDTLGWVFYRQGKYEEALREIERAERLVGDDPVIKEHLGDIHEVLGDREQAVRYWRESFLLDPDSELVPIKLEAYGVDLRALRRKLRKVQKRPEHGT